MVVYNWSAVTPLRAPLNSIMEEILRRHAEYCGRCECSASIRLSRSFNEGHHSPFYRNPYHSYISPPDRPSVPDNTQPTSPVIQISTNYQPAPSPSVTQCPTTSPAAMPVQTSDEARKHFGNIHTLADIWNQKHKIVDTFGIVTEVRPITQIPGPVAGEYPSPASLRNPPDEYMLAFAIRDPTVKTDIYIHLFSSCKSDLPVLAPMMAIALSGMKVQNLGGVSLTSKAPEFFWVRYDGGSRSLEGTIAMGPKMEGGEVVDIDFVLRRLKALASRYVRGLGYA